MNPETYTLKETDGIVTPALIYYKDLIIRNAQEMIAMAGGFGRLWPHVKSHKTADLVRTQMQMGIRRFKCATIAEGEMVGACGAEQAIIAYPLTGPNIGRFIRLAKAYPGTEYFAIGDDAQQFALLSAAAVAAGMTVNVLVDINSGLNRTGVPTALAGALYRKVAAMPALRVRGMHVYDGQRHERDLEERKRLVAQDVAPVYTLRDQLRAEGLDCTLMVMGGTPSFPCHAQYADAYLSPGTCLIQDYGYASTFADLPFAIGAMVATRVVSHPAPGLFTLDLGTKAVAADPEPLRAVIAGYEDAVTVKQNEEHWVLQIPAGRERPAIGTVLYAAPWHICPTSALYPEILVAQGGEIVNHWPVTARNRVITV